MNILKTITLSASLSLLVGCGGAAIVSTPVENIDDIPLKISELSENEMKSWSHLDLIQDTIPGMSVDRAYSEIIKNKKGQTVIVAVVDSGTDITHEDLVGNIWVNEDEIPNNGKDDDNNGYVDDVHGWNFLGDAYDEQLEYVRLLVSGNTNDPRYAEAQEQYQKQYSEYSARKTQYEQIRAQIVKANDLLKSHLKKEDYTKKDVASITTEDTDLQNAISLANYMFSQGYDNLNTVIEAVDKDLKSIVGYLNTHLNKNLKGRTTGDNPDDITDVNYGDNNVMPHHEDETHGTLVSGVIAAKRNNGIGMNGVANNVKIMAVRNTPNGDEYDKDVALAIRYAVDNGAKIINTSFGKSFSPHTKWVIDAISYAAEHDVLIVNAAGNDSKNIDENPSYPNDVWEGKEVADNFITVGALTHEYGTGVVASYSNYGKNNVDIFAPGSQIYSTAPNNSYKSVNGTSFASPSVAGVAALIRSLYPKLSASQVKQILMDSGLPLKTNVVVGGDPSNVKPFSELSKSGKIVNAYNALIMASAIAKGK